MLDEFGSIRLSRFYFSYVLITSIIRDSGLIIPSSSSGGMRRGSNVCVVLPRQIIQAHLVPRSGELGRDFTTLVPVWDSDVFLISSDRSFPTIGIAISA